MNTAALFERAKLPIKVGLALTIAMMIASWLGWDRPYWAGLAVTVMSMMETSGHSLRKGKWRLVGTFCGMTCAFLLSAFFAQDVGIMMALFTVLVGVCGYMIFNPLLMFSPVSANTEWHVLTDWQHPILLLVLFLAVCTVNTQIFRSKAYQLAESGSQLAPIIFTNLIFSMIWQVAFFDQPMSETKIIGVALIVIATLLNTFVPIWVRKKHERECAHSHS